MQSSHDSMWQFFAAFACNVAILDASWASEMIFLSLKRTCWTAWSELFLFHSFWLALNWYTERIFQAINVHLNALFSRQREVNYNDEGITLTLTFGYFKTCVTFLLQQLRSCKTIIFEERKKYNFKEWQCTSLHLDSKVEKSKLNMAVFCPLADDCAKLSL